MTFAVYSLSRGEITPHFNSSTSCAAISFCCHRLNLLEIPWWVGRRLCRFRVSLEDSSQACCPGLERLQETFPVSREKLFFCVTDRFLPKSSASRVACSAISGGRADIDCSDKARALSICPSYCLETQRWGRTDILCRPFRQKRVHFAPGYALWLWSFVGPAFQSTLPFRSQKGQVWFIWVAVDGKNTTKQRSWRRR